MREHQLAPPSGVRRPRKRIGRGDASGHGSYSGKGMKGQKSRSGKSPRPGFEGGQLPLIKRLPTKRGFINRFRAEYAEVSLSSLDRFPEGTEVAPEQMLEARLVKNLKRPIKVLANGKLTKPLVVKAHRFSRSARAQIEAVGGKVEEL
ncbi:MAG: 50S ribosomal protein L15 [Dehalococcoidia bacterium]